jgi:nicotinamidase-related amidase
MTHMCVEATARSAIDNGLKATVVASATATRDLPDPLTGGVVPAAEVQRNALAALADRFATVVAKVDDIKD